MSLFVGVTLGQRQKAFRELALHPKLQLRLWSQKHPLSSQDMAENFMVGWLPHHVGYLERERAASLVAKGAAIEDIRQAARFERRGFGISDVQMLYEWIDDKDQIVYVGITKNLQKRRRGHEQFRSKPGMKMRMVGFGTVDDETALIHKRLLAGVSLLNIKVVPLRGLDVFCDCSVSCLTKMLVVGIVSGVPPLRRFRVGMKGENEFESVLSAMRWNARIMVEKSLAAEARQGIDRLGYHGLSAMRIASDNLFPRSIYAEFLHCMRSVPQTVLQSAASGREPFIIPTWNRQVEVIEALCDDCGSLGLSPIWCGQNHLVHVDPVCCANTKQATQSRVRGS
jgi:hypothetical protein